VLSLEAAGETFANAIRSVSGVQHVTLEGGMEVVGKRTIYRWVAAFRKKGIEGLEPAGRPHCEGSEVLGEDFLTFLREQKKADPRASMPEVIKRARLLGVLDPEAAVDRGTVWRAARRLGVETKRRKKLQDRDMRRFAYPNRMQMMLCDGKHFRAGPGRLKRVALFFLDDASRLGLHVVVGTSENVPLFLRGLYETVRRHGFMDMVYLDRGPGFRAQDTGEAVRQLGAHWVLGEAGYPPAHGSIEKFNQTVQEDVLRFLPGNPGVDPDCGALTLRLQHWLREVYNQTPHEGIEDQTPQARWDADVRPLRFPEDDADLRRRFVVFEGRRVSADNVVPVDGVDYEVPRGHAGTRIQLHRHLLDGAIATVHDGRLVTLAPVDLAANATGGRARPGPPPDEFDPVLPKSAAEICYERDLAPVVGLDGGFSDPEPQEE
jgi:transposase InsO family protein